MKKIKIILLILISISSFNTSKAFVIFNENITFSAFLNSFLQNIDEYADLYTKNNISFNTESLLNSVLSEREDEFKILLFLSKIKYFSDIREKIKKQSPKGNNAEKDNLAIKNIIAMGFENLNNKQDINGNTFLHIAAKNNKFEIIKFTLTVLLDDIQNGKNQEIRNLITTLILKTNEKGQTILHVAVENGCRESIVEILKYLKYYLELTEDSVDFIFKENNYDQTVFDLLLKNVKKNNPQFHINSITVILLEKLILFHCNDYFIKKLANKLVILHPQKKDVLIELFTVASKKIFTPEIKGQYLCMQKTIDKLIQIMKNIDKTKQSNEKSKLKIKIPLPPHELLLENPYIIPQTPC